MKKQLLAIGLAVSMLCSGCSTKWVTVAQADLPILINITAAVVALADPQADAEIKEYGAEAVTDLQLVSSLIAEYNAAPASTKATKLAAITAALNEVSVHLTAILNAAHVKNGTKAQHIAQAVQVAILTVTSIMALIGNSKTAQLPQSKQLQAALDDLRSFSGK